MLGWTWIQGGSSRIRAWSRGMSASTGQESSLDPWARVLGESPHPFLPSQPAPPHCGHRGAAASQPSRGLCKPGSSWLSSAWDREVRRGKGVLRGGRARHRGRSLRFCSIYTEFLKNYNWLPVFKNQLSYPNSEFWAFLENRKIWQHWVPSLSA